jgi:hypothetical protein
LGRRVGNEAGQQDDRDGRMKAAKFRGKLKAIDPWHHKIGNDEVDWLLLELDKARLALFGDVNVIAERCDDVAQHLAHARVIIDQQYSPFWYWHGGHL